MWSEWPLPTRLADDSSWREGDHRLSRTAYWLQLDLLGNAQGVVLLYSEISNGAFYLEPNWALVFF
ncbi:MULTISPECIES: hypothetical protein [unclassified Sinorhizobium]|uniref:hypothetical protein n=1 Tax=unclassified Sinorhizobium TaxID=2613772 RepID=UPI0035262BA0